MNTYERLFGAGPRGILISFVLFVAAWELEPVVSLPAITDNDWVRWGIFALSIAGALVLALWSMKGLSPAARGKTLAATGAYRYFRHPLYATLVSCFHFGLAVLLNNWIYLLWAALTYCIWHWNIRSEERLMRRAFPDEYEKYCQVTGRFIPRLGSFRQHRER
ncbi:MAG: protein-S-isoprenylcysteine O-methyltransferase Ste14 [Candidatus Pelagisphaera sp.]|jgi:protein-S-isoprenylcysteine O-methyltransferase Ste14